MRRFWCMILAGMMLLTVLTGCVRREQTGDTAEEPGQQEETVKQETIRLGGLKGATSIGMVKLLDDAEQGKTVNAYEFTMAGSADELTPRFLKGELDVLAIPANLGAVLYQKSEGAVQMAAVNTLGVLYIVEKGGETVQSLADLKGKAVYATGKGSTPEFTLRYLLQENGVDMDNDLTVNWMSEPTEAVAAMESEENAIAMLPQPYVTVASAKLESLRVALDLTAEWDSLGMDSRLITAGLFVRKDFAEEHPEAMKSFLEEYAASTRYANDNVEETAELVEKYDIVKAAVARKAIPDCHIVCITGEEMEEAVTGFYEVLLEQKPESVGGALPGEDFYLSYEE